MHLDKVKNYFNRFEENSFQKKFIHSLGKKIGWENFVKVNASDVNSIVFDINDYKFNQSPSLNSFRKIIFFTNKFKEIDYEIYEVFSKTKFSDSLFIQLYLNIVELNKNNKKYTTFEDSINIIVYDKDYRRTSSFFNFKKVICRNNSIVNKLPTKIVNSVNVTQNQSTIQTQGTIEICELWGAYLTNKDENGNIVSRVLLYTYQVCRRYSDNYESEDPNDYGGNTTYNQEISECSQEEAQYRAEFDSYSSMTSSDGTTTAMPSSIGSAPIFGRFNWTVVENSFGMWRVEAISDYEYLHESHTIILPNGIRNEEVYNITKYRTVDSKYVGTNVLFVSEWSPSPVMDVILDNNTENARCTSRVSGTIRHKARTAAIALSCGTSLFLDVFVLVPGNQMTWKPK